MKKSTGTWAIEDNRIGHYEVWAEWIGQDVMGCDDMVWFDWPRDDFIATGWCLLQAMREAGDL